MYRVLPLTGLSTLPLYGTPSPRLPMAHYREKPYDAYAASRSLERRDVMWRA